MKRVVYDAGVLVEAERSDRQAWLEHKARLLERMVPLVPATVVAQVSRSPQQVQLRRFLEGCDIASLHEQDAHVAGRLLGKSKTSDVVDASVVAVAMRYQAVILTGDVVDMERVAAVAGAGVAVARL